MSLDLRRALACVWTRTRVQQIALIAVLITAGAVPAANAYSERYVFIGGAYADVYRAMDDGSDVRKLTYCDLTACNYANPALSPLGQTIALDTGFEQIDLMDVSGANQRVLVDDPYYLAWNPEFTPNGTQVTYTGFSGGAFGFYGVPQTCPPPYTTVPAQAIPDVDENDSGLVCYRGDNNCIADDNSHEDPPPAYGDYDAFSMYVEGDPLDGSGRWVVAGGEGDQEDVEFSPDQQTLAWTNRATPSETTKIWTAGGNTCDPAAPLNTSGQIQGDVWEPKISPDGTKIVFYGRPVPLSYPRQSDDDSEVFVMGVDGSNLQRLTNNNTEDYAPEWSPDGDTILFDGGGGYQAWAMNANGSNERRVISATAHPYLDPLDADPSYRRPTNAFTRQDVQAAEFRPILKFDSDEAWRPLNVEDFLAEGGHTVCQSRSETNCPEISNAGDLTNYNDGLLNIRGSQGEGNYHSPWEGCVVAGVQDCETGSRTAIYYHVSEPSPNNYRYVDYWFFYRYNDNIDIAGDHEGDWEDFTIAAPQPVNGYNYLETFHYGTFSQHGDRYSYLRELLSCDGGAPGSCGTVGDEYGSRVEVNVSNGSHANHPEECDRDPPVELCGGLGERSRDGQAPWLRNYDEPATALLRFPATRATYHSSWADGPRNWVDWPGNWSISDTNVISPGTSLHFWSPWSYNQCKGSSPCTLPADRSPRAEARCDRWFGEDIAALVCDSLRLRRALRDKRLGRRGGVSVRTAHSRSASAPGLAQAAGSPLAAGSTVTLEGRPSAGSDLRLRVRVGQRVYTARFDAHSAAGRGGQRSKLRVVVGRERRSSAPRIALRRGSDTLPATDIAEMQTHP